MNEGRDRLGAVEPGLACAATLTGSASRRPVMADTSTRTASIPVRVRRFVDVDGRVGSILAHRETAHMAKYAVVGVANVAIDLGVFALLVHFGVWYVAAR